MSVKITVREACRQRMPLGGTDAQALEHALAQTEKEIEELKTALGNAFVAGAKWWEFTKTGATMWQSDQQKAAEEAFKRKMPFRSIEERARQKENESLPKEFYGIIA